MSDERTAARDELRWLIDACRAQGIDPAPIIADELRSLGYIVRPDCALVEHSDDLDSIRLAAFAMRREGRDPYVIAHTSYWALTPAQRDERSYLVVSDELHERWVEQ